MPQSNIVWESYGLLNSSFCCFLQAKKTLRNFLICLPSEDLLRTSLVYKGGFPMNLSNTHRRSSHEPLWYTKEEFPSTSLIHIRGVPTNLSDLQRRISHEPLQYIKEQLLGNSLLYKGGVVGNFSKIGSRPYQTAFHILAITFDLDTHYVHSLYHWKCFSKIYNFPVIWFDKFPTKCLHFSRWRSGNMSVATYNTTPQP